VDIIGGHGSRGEQERMRKARLVPEVIGNGPWTCRRCLQGQNLPIQPHRARASKSISLRSISSKGNGIRISPTREPASDGARFSSRLFGGRISEPKPKPKSRRRLIILTAFISAGLVFAFTDTAQHGYAATKRSIRVLNALVRSVWE